MYQVSLELETSRLKVQCVSIRPRLRRWPVSQPTYLNTQHTPFLLILPPQQHSLPLIPPPPHPHFTSPLHTTSNPNHIQFHKSFTIPSQFLFTIPSQSLYKSFLISHPYIQYFPYIKYIQYIRYIRYIQYIQYFPHIQCNIQYFQYIHPIKRTPYKTNSLQN